MSISRTTNDMVERQLFLSVIFATFASPLSSPRLGMFLCHCHIDARMAVFYHAMLNQSAQLYLRARQNIHRSPDITANKKFCSHVVRIPLASDGIIQKQNDAFLAPGMIESVPHLATLTHSERASRYNPHDRMRRSIGLAESNAMYSAADTALPFVLVASII